MDLYYAMTNYQLIDCILHKITMNKNNKAIVLLSSFLVFHNPNILNNLKKSKIFENVIVYEETIFSYDKGINIQDEIQSISRAVGSKYGELIDGCNDIYLGQDHNSLGLFLVTKKRKFNYFEDASGTYSNPEILLNLIKKENRNRYNIIKELKLGGRSEYVEKVYCDFEHQKKGFDDSLCIDFSIKKILKKLDEKDLDKILKIYRCHKYDLKNKKMDLLLTWHYNNMRLMTLDEQREFFALLIDYFKDETSILFIKPHPSDKQSDYKKWFKDSVVFDRLMPSELLPFCVNDKFEKGITNWSTSVFGLQEVLKDVVNFDKDIDHTYRDFHKYFAVIECLKKIKDIKVAKKLITKGINEKQFYQLLRYHFKDYEKYYYFASEGDGIYISKKYDDTLRDKNCIILNGSGVFLPQSIISIIAGDREDCIYLYNLSVNDLFVEKDMRYSGYKLFISSRGVSEYIAHLKDELDKQKKIKQKDKKTIKELSNKVDNYRRQRDVLRAEVDGMLSSSSWKLTKPLRKLNSVRRKNEDNKN